MEYNFKSTDTQSESSGLQSCQLLPWPPPPQYSDVLFPDYKQKCKTSESPAPN